MIFAHRLIRRSVHAVCLMISLCVLLPIGGAQAQTPEEHASHHPGAAPAAAGAMPAAAGAPGMAGMGPPTGAGPPAGAGGMMAGMGEMMANMGKPPPKQLYPTLMALPELTPEKRMEVEHAAAERMHAGTTLMGQALDVLNAGTRSGDYAAMHEATTRLREGVAQLESGIAARRALAEGRAPRDVALAWFKREMRLTAPVSSDEAHGGRGLSVLHLLTMALLVIFAFAMLLMYFFKMRRATALFGRIEPDKKSPPPGSSPPLEGGDGSPGGKSPPDGKTPPTAKPGADKAAPPASSDKSAKPPEAPAEKAAVPPTATPGADATQDDKAPAPAAGEKSPASPEKSPKPPEPPAEKPPEPAPTPKAS